MSGSSCCFSVGGEFFCIDDVCTHDGGPLSEGQLDDHTIACPRHGAKFDIRTGKALTMPATVDTAGPRGESRRRRHSGVELNEPGAARAATPATTATPATALRRLPVVSPRTGVEATPVASDASGSPATTCRHAGQLSEDLVREELKKVIDPELFVNIVDLGLIYNVDLVAAAEGKTNCKIDMTMTSPMCPAGPQMIANSKQVLGQLQGMGDVEVKIVLDPPWTPDKMTQEARGSVGDFLAASPTTRSN